MEFIKKIVGDLILFIPMQNVEEILQTFNSNDNHIQFTVEKEVERFVSFLETSPQRQR